MKFNPITKAILRTLVTKMAKLEHSLPSDEKERIYYLQDLCRDWNQRYAEIDDRDYFIVGTEPKGQGYEAGDFSTEEYIKLNYALLNTIWFSDRDYDTLLQIEALENIVREYRNDPAIETYIVPDGDVLGCQQMLIRNYVEHPDCPKALIERALSEYDEMLGEDDRLAYCDERLNYLATEGELDALPQMSREILTLPKGEHSDCYACINNRLVRCHILTGDFEGAAVLIDKIFDDKLTCDLIPKTTKVQKVLVDEVLGRNRGSSQSAEKSALRNLKAQDSMVYEAYFLLTYALHTENEVLGRTVVKRFEEVVKPMSSPEKVYYCLAAYKITGEQSYYDEGLKLAKRFDERSGRRYYQRTMQDGRNEQK